MNYDSLLRKPVRKLPVYQPGRPIELVARELGLDPRKILKLASNENPLGPSPAAVKAARDAMRDVWLYPDNNGYQLVRALERKFGLTADCHTLAAGSNEVFYLLCDLFVEPGVEVVMGEYAFVSYLIATTLAGGTPVRVPMPEFKHDLNAMASAITDRTRLVFLPNPNNPTGTSVPAAAVEDFVRGLPEHVVFCYDEAYREYEDDALDVVRLIGEGHRIVATRTFSKIHGLAGMRIGYAMSDPALARLLNAVRPPFNTGIPAQAAALAALDDEDWIQRSREANQAGMRQLEKGFAELGLSFVSGCGNFILVAFADADNVNRQLMQNGIIVRPLKGYDLPDHLRITVGTEPQNARLLQTLSQILSTELS